MLDSITSRIISHLRRNDLALFVGAGTSINSGIPVSYHIKKSILQNAGCPEDDLNLILGSYQFPFEAFMETVIESDDLQRDALLSVFRSGKPNTNHLFIAALLKEKLVDLVFTTNFDRMIEQALGASELHVISGPGSENLSGSGRPLLAKIHGCISSPQQLGTELSAVANRSHCSDMARTIDYIFRSGPHRAVLVVGYSFSDDFDINPAIELPNDSQKVIFVINHCQASAAPGSLKYRQILRRFTCVDLQIDTDEFIEHLWTTLNADGIVKEPFTAANYAIELEENIAQWSANIHYRYPESIVAYLFTSLSRNDRAISHFQLSLEKARIAADEKANLAFCEQLSSCFLLAGDLRQAFNYASSAMDIAQKHEDERGLLIMLSHYAWLYFESGNHAQGVAFNEKALALAKKLANGQIERSCLNRKAVFLLFQGDYFHAAELLKEGLASAQAGGDKGGEVFALGNLGLCYSRINEPRWAVDYFQKGAALAALTGNKAGEQNCLLNLAAEYCKQGDYAAGILHLEKSLFLAQEISDIHGKGMCLKNLANAYRALGDHASADIYEKQLYGTMDNIL